MARLPLTPALDLLYGQICSRASRKATGLADAGLVGSPARCRRLVEMGYIEVVRAYGRDHYRPLPEPLTDVLPPENSGEFADSWRIACAKQMVLQDAAAAGAREALRNSGARPGDKQYQARASAVRRHEHTLATLQQVWQDALGLNSSCWDQKATWDAVEEASGIFRKSPRKA